MATRIEASLKKLEDQAVLSTFRYLKESKNKLDEMFGKDFAKTNPQIMVALVQTMSDEYRTSTNLQGLQGIDEEINSVAHSVNNIAMRITPAHMKKSKSFAPE